MLSRLAVVADMECDLIVEHKQAGLARAKAVGKALGRPLKTTAEQRAAMIKGYVAKKRVSALAKLYGVSRATVLTIEEAVVSDDRAAATATL